MKPSSFVVIVVRSIENTSNFVPLIYKKYQRNGMMYLNSFTLNLVFVGDFETLKYLFNHPDVQLRFTKEGGMRNASVEERKVKSKEHFPGKISSFYELSE